MESTHVLLVGLQASIATLEISVQNPQKAYSKPTI